MPEALLRQAGDRRYTVPPIREAAGNSTRLVGIRIRSDSDLKLYRKGEYPVLPGLA